MISIKTNEKPSLPICRMNCDGGLDDALNRFEVTKFLNKHQMTLLIGRPKSGKTSLLYALFKGQRKNRILRGVYSSVYIFQPSNSRNSMTDNVFDLIPDDQKFDELTLANLEEVNERVTQDSADGYTSCIIYDDMGSYLKNADTLKLFKDMAMNKRHKKLSQFFLCQTWYSVPKELRRLWDNIIVFKVSKDEMGNIFDEVVENNDKTLPFKISKIVYDAPHNWLFIHLESQRFFKGFDELLIDG